MSAPARIHFLPVAARPGAAGLRLSELLSALSHALDLTEGQPEGHCVRCCWIGTRIGRELGLSEPQLWELYYTLLLKDVGCSSNAARISALYRTDDLSFKRDVKVVGDGLPERLRFVASHTGQAIGALARLRTLVSVVPQSNSVAAEVIATRCERGADIARRLRFSDAVADGIRGLDEHWDGKGLPAGAKGAEIPIYSQIALLAQVADVFHFSAGRAAAGEEIRGRAGTWFDPALVAVFERAAARHGFWETLAAPSLEAAILELEPAQHTKPLDEDFLDDIAAAFAQVVDSKSPYTSGHSSRVADLTDRIAAELGLTYPRRRWLKRAALLHDIGKLGVSSLILDKQGPLTPAEWVAMRNHAALTEKILSRIAAFGELAVVAGAHHERLDGKGYPHGLRGDQIVLETRILTTADIFDALTAKRPYRDAMPEAKALEIMAAEAGTAIDPACLAALRRALIRRQHA
ncbi:MAG: HD domain-containing phosphohydrolase [Bauldia sp.]